MHRMLSSALSTHNLWDHYICHLGVVGLFPRAWRVSTPHEMQPINVEFSCTEEILESVWRGKTRRAEPSLAPLYAKYYPGFGNWLVGDSGQVPKPEKYPGRDHFVREIYIHIHRKNGLLPPISK